VESEVRVTVTMAERQRDDRQRQLSGFLTLLQLKGDFP